jgi:hypothetical protein
MKALRGYDWQLSGAGRAWRLPSRGINIVDFELDELEKATIGLKQEILSVLAIAGLVLAAYALM